MDQLHALLDGRADVNAAMNYGDGWTPLWHCRNYQRPLWKETEAVLLERGAVMRPLWSVAKCAEIVKLPLR